MKNLLPVFLFSLVLLAACGDGEAEQNDRVQTQDISKESAIETVVSTELAPDSMNVLLITTHKVWLHNALSKELRKVDTIPYPGTPFEKKDYEFYITVK